MENLDVKSKLGLCFVSSDQFQLELNRSRKIALASAPGRVNLIGDHVDYCGGQVLPFCIDQAISFEYSEASFAHEEGASDPKIMVRSDQCNDVLCVAWKQLTASFQQGSPAFQFTGNEAWLNYIIGCLYFYWQQLNKNGLSMHNGRLVLIDITSDLPQGAGISSSAALSVGLLGLVFKANSIECSPMELAKMAQQVEHQFCGVLCGLMDQMAIANGKKDHLIKINFSNHDDSDPEVDLIELHENFQDWQILLFNTELKHELSSTPYNQRTKACEKLLAMLNRALAKSATSLGEYSRDAVFLSSIGLVKKPIDQVLVKGLLQSKYLEHSDEQSQLASIGAHVFCEIQRVVLSVSAIRQGNLEVLDQLMNQSHMSLSEDYKVSCFELDLARDLVKEWANMVKDRDSLGFNPVLGPRMTGGGFGGGTIQLIHKDYVTECMDYFQSKKTKYYRKTGLLPTLYRLNIGRGFTSTQL